MRAAPAFLACLKEVWTYDPATGLFSRRYGPTRRKPEEACRSDYVRVNIDGRTYLAHRLAWLYMTGEWPPDDIDHKNGNRRDNRFENLRLATRSQNLANRKLAVTNRCGLKGVCFHPRKGKWEAAIRENGRKKHLGYFANKEAAHAAYVQAAALIHREFARAA